jgi:hypothetical protein
MSSLVARRVVDRYAKEFSTEEALRTYLQEHPKADLKKHWVRKPKQEFSEEGGGDYSGRPSSEKSTFKGVLKSTNEDLEAVIAQHGKTFDRITEEAKEDLDAFEPKKNKFNTYGSDEDLVGKLFPKLSEAEKAIYVGGHEIGSHFQKKVLNKSESKLHERFFRQWTTSAGSYQYDNYGNWDHSSSEMQGLVSSLGVSGHIAPEDKEVDGATGGALTKARQKAASNPKLKTYVKKLYDFQQAYFRSQGIKELTLYRGFQGQGVGDVPPSVGTPVNVESRELSSFTANPDIAKRFGRVVEYKIPVERIFASSLVRPEIGSETYPYSFDEAEFLIMGASDLTGTIISEGGKGKKTAASKVKPLKLKITNKNEGWLQGKRKNPKPKKRKKDAAARVIRRFMSPLTREGLSV